jgi:hypothetical protein
MVNTMPQPPVPLLQEAGWAPGLVWRDVENLTPPGFDPQTVQSAASFIPVCTDIIQGVRKILYLFSKNFLWAPDVILEFCAHGNGGYFNLKLGVSSSNQCNLHHSQHTGHLGKQNKKGYNLFRTPCIEMVIIVTSLQDQKSVNKMLGCMSSAHSFLFRYFIF